MIQENLATLYTIEKCILRSYRSHPEITDHAVRRVYEAATSYYRAVAAGRPADAPALGGVEGVICDELLATCEVLRTEGVGETELQAPATESEPVSAQTLQRCLNRLVRSVEKGTKRAGVTGYLNLIATHVR